MKSKVNQLLFVFLSLLLPASLSAQGIILSVPDSFTTIQSAINAADSGDTVLVDRGTYYENIAFRGKKITVASLFIKTGNNTDIALTRIDGGQKGSVVTFNNDISGSVLTGFYLKNGKKNAAYGGGIYIYNSNPVLKDLKIWRNSAKLGGGIFMNKSNPVLSNINFRENSAGSEGGGIFIFESGPVLNNLHIIRNTASTNGGGILIKNSNIILNNTVIARNEAGFSGGGIWHHGDELTLKNAYFDTNDAIWGGRDIHINSSKKVYLCNITMISIYKDPSINLTAELRIKADEATIVNSIILPFKFRRIYVDDTLLEIKYSNVKLSGISLHGSSEIRHTDSVIDKDPIFVNSGQSDYRLRANSPCIDTGIPDTTGLALPATDLAGNIRIRDGRVDMGAYEWDGTTSGFPPILPSWTADPAGFQDSMRLKGVVYFNSFYLMDTLSYAGAFVNGECRGTAGIKEFDDWISGIDMTIYGNNAGETVSFKIWNNDYEEEFELAETVTFTPGDSLGTDYNPVQLSYTFVTAIKNEIKTPETYKLSQNYPNPFNPETTINFALPKQGRVRLVIYDILGRPVKTLADGTYAAGIHSLKWNGRNDAGEQAASGAYIYRIVTKSFTGAKKMMYMK